jgi:hypothetical protein
MFKKKYLVLILALVLAILPFQAYSSSLKYIMLKINSKTAYVNMMPVQLDVAPIEINGRTLVPLRFIAEHFGAKNITYYPETEEISLELEDASVLRMEISRLNDLLTSLQNENKQLQGEIASLQQRIRELEGQKPPPTDPSVQPPFAPQNLQAVLSDLSVVLTWSPSAMGTYPIAGYKVFRMEQSQGVFSLIGISPANGFSYVDKSVAEGFGYSYYIKAFDTHYPANESVESNRVSISIPKKDPPQKELQAQYVFPDKGYLYNLRYFFIEEDHEDFYFGVTTYRPWKFSTSWTYFLSIDVDRNVNTGNRLPSGTKMGYELIYVFGFSDEGRPFSGLSKWNESKGSFETAELYLEDESVLDENSLIFFIPRKYFINRSSFDYNMMLMYDDKSRDAEYYPAFMKNLTYPRIVQNTLLGTESYDFKSSKEVGTAIREVYSEVERKLRDSLGQNSGLKGVVLP